MPLHQSVNVLCRFLIDHITFFILQQTDEKFDFEDEVTQLSDIFADYEAHPCPDP